MKNEYTDYCTIELRRCGKDEKLSRSHHRICTSLEKLTYFCAKMEQLWDFYSFSILFNGLWRVNIEKVFRSKSFYAYVTFPSFPDFFNHFYFQKKSILVVILHSISSHGFFNPIGVSGNFSVYSGFQPSSATNAPTNHANQSLKKYKCLRLEIFEVEVEFLQLLHFRL